jgi:hypothetical protein
MQYIILKFRSHCYFKENSRISPRSVAYITRDSEIKTIIYSLSLSLSLSLPSHRADMENGLILDLGLGDGCGAANSKPEEIDKERETEREEHKRNEMHDEEHFLKLSLRPVIHEAQFGKIPNRTIVFGAERGMLDFLMVSLLGYTSNSKLNRRKITST